MRHLNPWQVFLRLEEIQHRLRHYDAEVPDSSLRHLMGWVFAGEVQVLEQKTPSLIAVTEIVQRPQAKVLRILAVAGKDLRSFDWAEFESWAKAQGVDWIEGQCSKAGARLFSRFGYKPTSTLVRKEL